MHANLEEFQRFRLDKYCKVIIWADLLVLISLSEDMLIYHTKGDSNAKFTM